MRTFKALLSSVLLALASASSASPATVDPNSDFDCAIISRFYFHVAEARKAPADERELTFVMSEWFSDQWNRDHPGEGAKHMDRYNAVVNALGDDPNAYREMIRTCGHRATSDAAFEPFWILHRKDTPALR
jgi:hypothetical protein